MNIYNCNFRIIFVRYMDRTTSLKCFMIIPIYLSSRPFSGIKIPFSTYIKLFKLTLFVNFFNHRYDKNCQTAYSSRNPKLMRNLLGGARRRGGIKMS